MEEPSTSPKKKMRLEKEDNKDDRNTIKQEKRGKEKLLLTIAYSQKVGAVLSQFFKVDNNFYNRNVASLVKCWEICHQKDVNATVATWKKNAGTFKTTN